MFEAIDQVLREHAYDGESEEPGTYWTVTITPVTVRVEASTAQTFGTEQQAFTAATLLSNRLAQVGGVRPSPDASQELGAVGIEGESWRGRVDVVLQRA